MPTISASFRVDGLLPGEYLVIASPATATRDTTLMPTDYQATADQGAAIPIRVGPGDTVSGITNGTAACRARLAHLNTTFSGVIASMRLQNHR